MAMATPLDPDDMSKTQRANIRRRQGCSPEDYAKVFVDQDDKCACCAEGPKPPARHLRADTFRKDNKITLICQPCYDLIKTFDTNSAPILAYLESSRKITAR